MKVILLFKSKMCGPCRMFEPQLKAACEECGVQYIPVDVEENETFTLWKPFTTSELIQHFSITSSGRAVYIHDSDDENSQIVWFNKPTKKDEIIRNISI